MNILMIICQKSSGSVSTSSKCSSINSENSASSGLMVKGLLLLQINTIYTKYQIGFCNLLAIIQIYLNLYDLCVNRLRMCRTAVVISCCTYVVGVNAADQYRYQCHQQKRFLVHCVLIYQCSLYLIVFLSSSGHKTNKPKRWS